MKESTYSKIVWYLSARATTERLGRRAAQRITTVCEVGEGMDIRIIYVADWGVWSASLHVASEPRLSTWGSTVEVAALALLDEIRPVHELIDDGFYPEVVHA